MFFSCFPSIRRRRALPEIPDFNAAGTLFMNETHVLAAYQKDAGNPTISGIGGKREGNETYMETAMRETVEELFGLSVVPPALIARLIHHMEPRRIERVGTYVIIMYNFEDLEKILKIAHRYIKTSPVYRLVPHTVSSLVLNRRSDVKPRPEISHFAVVPILNDPIIDVEFLEDIETILKRYPIATAEPPLVLPSHEPRPPTSP